MGRLDQGLNPGGSWRGGSGQAQTQAQAQAQAQALILPERIRWQR